jgi:quercetin dioxygenase-like cupin family protein
MQKLNLNVLIEYDDKRFNPKVLMNEPGYHMVLLSMRAGQRIPEHASKGTVAMQAILGHITLYAGPFPNELYAGEVICIESGVSHRIEAIEDSALLVLSTRRLGFLHGALRRGGFVPGSETTTSLACV